MAAPHEPASSNDRPTPAEVDAIASRSFSTSFRGWDPDEVRVHLVKVAELARALTQSQADLERRLAEAEAAARRADVSQLDPDEVAQILGEETARVLRTARESSEEIRAKAEERVAVLSRQAADDAAKVRAEATEEAERLRAAAAEEAEATRRAGETYATELRAEAEAELSARRAAAEEELAAASQAGRDEVAQLSAAAEDAAAAVRRIAEERATELRAEADAYAAKVRTDADIYAERVRAEADLDVATRSEELEAEIARRHAESERLIAEARAADEAERAAAAEQAAAQVAEAERVRERVLADLARKRKAARQHLEQLRAGRDRLLDAYEVVRSTTELATGELGAVLPDAKRLADEAARRVATEPEQTVAEIEAELALAREADLPLLSPDEVDDPGVGDDEDTVLAEEAPVEVPAESAESTEVVEPDEPQPTPAVEAAAPPEPVRPPAPAKLHGRRARRRGGDPLGGESLPEAPLEPVEAGAEFEGVRVLEDAPAEAPETPPAGAVAPATEPEAAESGMAAAPATEPEAAESGMAAAPEPSAADGAQPEPVAEASSDATDAPKGAAARASAAEAALSAVGKVKASPESPAGEASPDSADADVADIFERIRKGHEEGPAPVAESGGAAADDAPPEPSDAAVSEEEARLASLFERRDAAVDEVGRRVAKRLKRLLSDEQSTLLDELRRARKQPAAAALLGDPADFLSACTKAVSADLSGASAAGVALAGDLHDDAVDHPVVDLDPVAEEVARTIVEPLRARLERALGEGSLDDDEEPSGDPVDELELADRIRACYREWRGPRLTVAVTDACASAFGLGLRAALPESVGLRWFTDRGDKPCPDCDDNGLAGVVAAGERFPTGQLVPPAHPGCRCLALPPVDALPHAR